MRVAALYGRRAGWLVRISADVCLEVIRHVHQCVRESTVWANLIQSYDAREHVAKEVLDSIDLRVLRRNTKSLNQVEPR